MELPVYQDNHPDSPAALIRAALRASSIMARTWSDPIQWDHAQLHIDPVQPQWIAANHANDVVVRDAQELATFLTDVDQQFEQVARENAGQNATSDQAAIACICQAVLPASGAWPEKIEQVVHYHGYEPARMTVMRLERSFRESDPTQPTATSTQMSDAPAADESTTSYGSAEVSQSAAPPSNAAPRSSAAPPSNAVPSSSAAPPSGDDDSTQVLAMRTLAGPSCAWLGQRLAHGLGHDPLLQPAVSSMATSGPGQAPSQGPSAPATAQTLLACELDEPRHEGFVLRRQAEIVAAGAMVNLGQIGVIRYLIDQTWPTDDSPPQPAGGDARLLLHHLASHAHRGMLKHLLVMVSKDGRWQRWYAEQGFSPVGDLVWLSRKTSR